MPLLIIAQHVWPALVAACLFGAVVGASTAGRGARTRVGSVAGLLLVVAMAALIVSSARGAIAGRWGVWLDLGTVILACYLGGCALGCLLHRLTRAEPVATLDRAGTS